MSIDINAVVVKAAAAYNAASDRYDDRALSFWERFGNSTVDRVQLKPGARVLDLCCGTGASAIPAAQVVGPSGRVLAVDVAEKLLAVGREKAEALGLANVEFRHANVLEMGLPDEDFDAVICVFGIFFMPDMSGAVRQLWRKVRLGGKLAITTWGPRVFEPANGFFWEAVGKVRSDLHKSFNPWDRIDSPDSLRRMLEEGGVEAAEVEAEAGRHSLSSADDWWTIVMGSGYRGTVDRLSATETEQVRTEVLSKLNASRVRSIEANVVYSIAVKG